MSNKVYENGLLKMVLVDGGYIEGSTYHFYMTDHLGNNRVVTKADGTQVQKTHYYPFGSSFGMASGTSTQPYKYNGKELDKMHGLNLYDYSARYYERSAIGRFTTVDPLAEKKPWLSPYIYCSNNPINRIDPDGRDDIYNMQGRRIEQTPSGANIKVRIGGTDILLSDLNMASQEHRGAVTGLLSYYMKDSGISVYAKGMIPIGDNPIGTAGLSKYGGDTNVAAYASNKDIWLNTGGNKINNMLNNKYNLINTLVHEGEHKSQNTDTSKSGLKGPIREINAIQAQMEHPSYSKTTKAYQGSMMGYIIKQINSLSMRDEAVTTIVNKANSLNKNYRIDFERSEASSYILKVVEINEQKKK